LASSSKKPGADLGDLKARLGLNKALEKKPEVVEPPPSEPSFSPPPPDPMAGQSMNYGGPPQPVAPAGPPPGFRAPPPQPPKKLKRKEPTDWQPPSSDPTAAADVEIRDHSGKNKMLVLVGAVLISALLFGAAGYFFGSGSARRQIYNAQTTDAQTILAVVKPRAEKVATLYAAVAQHDAAAPDAELLKQMEELDFVVEPEQIATGKLLLGAELTASLVRFSADSKLLQSMMREHVRLTLSADKKELAELAEKKELSAANFSVIFDGEGYVRSLEKKGTAFRPAQGQLVIFDDQEPVEKKEDLFVKVRYPRSGKELEIPMKNMVLIERTDILGAGGDNALVRYTRRHKQIALKLQEMVQYTEVMVKNLDELSKRDPAGMLSTGE